MNIQVICGTHSDSLEVSQPATVFEALRSANYYVNAPCGGRGLCGKCKLVIRDKTGASYRLSCQTPVADGMEVVLEEQRVMKVTETGQVHDWPVSPQPQGYGFAIDIGTTTVVCRLHDLRDGHVVGALGQVNPQVVYGADVISRIQASNEGHLINLSTLIQETLADMMDALLESEEIPASEVKAIEVVGNTIMLHLLTGLDPRGIGVAPYEPLDYFGKNRHIPTFEKHQLNGGWVTCAPCLSGYVGADITTGLLAIDILQETRPCLFLDLGTNGEMALGWQGGISACATAAGPVFEGATIKHGMPAYDGAICAVDTVGTELRVEVINHSTPQGLCGTALIDVIALLLRHGILDESGLLLDTDEIDLTQSAGLERYLCKDEGERAFRVAYGITVTQRDIRNFQLAKGSIAAGIQTLLIRNDMTLSDIGSVQIAGGFAGHLNLENAARVGLIPQETLACSQSVGNTAIEGSSSLLMSIAAQEELGRIMAACRYFELSVDHEFNRLYPEALVFPE